MRQCAFRTSRRRQRSMPVWAGVLALTFGGLAWAQPEVKFTAPRHLSTALGTTTVKLYCDDGDDVNETSLRITISPMDDAPVVLLDRPADADTVSGTVDITGQAVDIEKELSSVELRIDNGGWLNLGDQQVASVINVSSFEASEDGVDWQLLIWLLVSVMML